jgi:hypothetical protein
MRTCEFVLVKMFSKKKKREEFRQKEKKNGEGNSFEKIKNKK